MPLSQIFMASTALFWSSKNTLFKYLVVPTRTRKIRCSGLIHAGSATLPSLTIENYVKTIYRLCTRQGNRPASTGRLAELLEVSPGTVTSMLKTLKDAGLAEYKPYEGVRLTDSGRSLALRVLRRHRLIELFLAKTLNLNWDEVHDEAENMEHAVSDLLVDRIDEYLGYPGVDPHGDPIPRSDGTITYPKATTLAQWPIGEPFRLIRVVDQSSEFLRYLSENGFQLGAAGEVTAIHSTAGIILVTVNGRETPLSLEVAEKLLVDYESASQ
jgi:DtxR family transcriptional regulator, Mn-dependent transcriptional regulator